MTSRSRPGLTKRGTIEKRGRERPHCPMCATSMIVIRGFHLEQEQKTFECLHCGHVGKTGTASRPINRS
jgi:ribosomal protein L37AE/L43A